MPFLFHVWGGHLWDWVHHFHSFSWYPINQYKSDVIYYNIIFHIFMILEVVTPAIHTQLQGRGKFSAAMLAMLAMLLTISISKPSIWRWPKICSAQSQRLPNACHANASTTWVREKHRVLNGDVVILWGYIGYIIIYTRWCPQDS